jgi:hypothetical protein
MTIEEIDNPAIQATTLLERWSNVIGKDGGASINDGNDCWYCELQLFDGREVTCESDTIDAAIRAALRKWVQQ